MYAMFKGQPVLGESASSEEVYSTEETRIGTWIDGKPIYRRVYTGTLGNTAHATKEIASVSSLNIDTCISIVGCAQSLAASGVFKYPIGFSRLVNDWDYVSATIYNNKLNVYTAHPDLYNQPIVLIIEYTKTTD